jgi:hypothetical protein
MQMTPDEREMLLEMPQVHELIRAAVLEEREACAAIADRYSYPPNDVGRLDGRGEEAEAIAAEIRARSTS